MKQDFLEYLNSKGQMQEPKTQNVADDVDIPKDRDQKPPKGQGMVGNQQPYSADGKGVSKGKDKGFGDQGDSNLKIDVKSTKKVKIPTAEGTLAQQVRNAVLDNPKILEHLVNEFHKSGLLGALVGELTTYRETFQHLTEVMANENYGPAICDRFARCLQESVSPGKFGGSKEDFDSEVADFEGDEPEDDMMDDDMGEAPFDEEPPSDEELEPTMDGMPARKGLPMPKALEHLSYSLKKNFI